MFYLKPPPFFSFMAAKAAARWRSEKPRASTIVSIPRIIEVNMVDSFLCKTGLNLE